MTFSLKPSITTRLQPTPPLRPPSPVLYGAYHGHNPPQHPPPPFWSNFFARPLIHSFPTAPRILHLLLHCGGRRFHGPTRRTMAALECVSQHLHLPSPNSRRLRCPPAAFCCHKPPPRPPPPPPRTGEMFCRQVSIRALPEQLLACANRGGPVYRVNRLGFLFPRCANFPL